MPWLLVCGARAAITASAVPRRRSKVQTRQHIIVPLRRFACPRACRATLEPTALQGRPATILDLTSALHTSPSVLQWRSPTASAPALRCWVAPPHSSPAGQFYMHLPALNAKRSAGLLLLGLAAWQLQRQLQRRLKSQPQRRGLSTRRRQHSWNSCRPRWVKPSRTR